MNYLPSKQNTENKNLANIKKCQKRLQFNKGDMEEGNGSSWIWLRGVFCSPTRLPFAIMFSLRRCWSSLKREDIIVTILALGTFLFIYGFTSMLNDTLDEYKENHWYARLLVNLVTYSAIVFPAILVLKYVQRSQYLESGPKLFSGAIASCFFGHINDELDESLLESRREMEEVVPVPVWRRGLQVFVCFSGILFFYLTWGYLQEKIMTRKYVDSTGQEDQFDNSQFLVFVNRITAFAVGLLWITILKQPRHRSPLYKYSYCSFTNIMSSWCQYEALKFISFPTQVLGKASKIIPVMVMGWIVSRKKYEKYEYIVAAVLSIGMALFLFGNPVSKNANTTTTFSGFILLIAYLCLDSFTSNWQNELFKTYKMSKAQMMCGVNLFSCLFTSVSLMQQGAFFKSLVFMSQYPDFTYDCVVLSICSALGQIFIFNTIKEFGNVHNYLVNDKKCNNNLIFFFEQVQSFLQSS